MNYLIGIDTSAHDRMMQKYGRYFPKRTATSIAENDDDAPRLCIEGKAVLTDEPIGLKTGEIIVIERGAFNDHFASGARTEVWFAHDPKEVIGSTASGLEFVETSDGLAFRLPLSNQRYADTIERMVTSGKQAAISVGITHTKSREEMVGRHKVTFVESAELREISLVAAGACDQAFARLIDADHALPLKDSIESISFKIDSGIHNAKTQRGKNASRIEALAERLDSLDQRRRHNTFSADPAPSKAHLFTIQQSNRAQTEETERLQALARARLCR
jgi:HK97 family phage prohead protease